ncbi:MAG: DUF2130 domain-containing protein, partial [Paludibacteraceae bacterium]|nr:DUF2130 domain-containing protein [Paludibacteraceae bacterium]
MKELKCPKCGNVFQVDEADYASIVSQVKNAEFDAELNRRLEELSKNQKAEQALVTARTEQQYQSVLNRKDLDIKEKDSIIGQLRNELHIAEEKKSTEIKLAIADKEKEIAALHSSIVEGENKLKIAVMNEHIKAQESIKDKEEEIAQLKLNVQMEKQQAVNFANSIKEQYEYQLKMAKEQLDYYKEMKIRMSTKMIGESLEIHCSTQFNQMMRPVMPNAYFEKDN